MMGMTFEQIHRAEEDEDRRKRRARADEDEEEEGRRGEKHFEVKTLKRQFERIAEELKLELQEVG